MAGRLPNHEWVDLREQILQRDGYECQDCGKGERGVKSLHVHHKRPLDDGGSNEPGNLRTLCEDCHFDLHADEQRKGTLEDIKDIYRRSEVPVFRTGEIGKLLDNYSHQAAPKLKKLVEKGFLESNGNGVYYRSSLPIDDVQIVNANDVIVDGSYIEFGKYIVTRRRLLNVNIVDGGYTHGTRTRN
ncbi:HNH endonuclease [Halosolutus gelatinilyticus]|uniref:HNH endonuclease n=1 Tax=Halosolutus gelatinilyticus TaxID=2931975 RepID=UPI001FF5A205|nr:HNH endonuclease [Halosolutus gelatinilyticus]